ncbi:FAD-binding domain-containing protein [Roseovarius salinarum]|uniref:FAD-binding domain-containing protein n=1 Tax=Roseovarius salinarum TaxID=1981892 RepID=UPI000C32996E|nr:FAD-binding domain-containing protein [Roseovarius salinarum]
MGVICWFKRDLRVADHPALARAAALGPVIPLYIVEPHQWRQADASGRQYAFLCDCLDSLRAELASTGLELVVRVGVAPQVLEALRAAHRVTDLVSHEETGNAASFARDRAVADWAAAQGVRWHEVPQSGVVRRLASRDGWQARRDAFVSAPVVPRIEGARGVSGAVADPLPAAADLGLVDACPDRQRGGRARAERALAGFLRTRGQHYRAAMSAPEAGARACSRLSPHLAFGTLSVREAVQAGRAAPAGRGRAWAGSMRSFRSRLAWRDHFMQKLEDEPALEWRCLHPAYEALRPAEPDTARLAAWAAGETGLPFVDACMRSLNATGWLNFRMRAMVMAVASYHLWLDWRDSGAVLARLFTDYEPGIHWSQVQMQSGVTGTNQIRIYNPVKQGHEQDPAGRFTRRWVPELARVPDAHLQTPWTWDGAGGLLGRAYPEPLVDVAAAARAARAAVWAVRRQAGFAEAAAQVRRKHASRKRPPAARRAPRGDSRQMGFEF